MAPWWAVLTTGALQRVAPRRSALPCPAHQRLAIARWSDQSSTLLTEITTTGDPPH